MTSPTDRRKALEILDGAVAAGARAREVAALLGVGLTTLQRWRRQFAGDGDGLDRRKGSPRHVAHRLSEEERHLDRGGDHDRHQRRQSVSGDPSVPHQPAHPLARRMAYRLLRREGWSVNHKRVQRLWREEDLQRPTPRKRKRARPADGSVRLHRAAAAFMEWYVHEHRHSAIKFVTPQQRHSGQAPAICQQRTLVYEQAREQHPRRWSRSIRCWQQPAVVWINEPPDATTAKDELLFLQAA